jgi:2-polyprenyl-6-methoxyphenol hydroxylase-like FAD-dependent oxidoreductase
MMLGFLLARQGIDVTVLEKHKDFFRDFRGDTIHPSTLELFHQLGLLDALLDLPHSEISELAISFGDKPLPIVDLTHLPTHAHFIALMPQWDLLDFIAKQASQLPNFHLLMEHQVVGLIETERTTRQLPRVIGVHVSTPTGPTHIHAALVVGCDGRHATTRASAHLRVVDHGVPIDVLWFRLSRNQDKDENTLGNLNHGTALILINRIDYFQCGFIIAKDSFETEIQPAGLEAFRKSIVRVVPFLADRVLQITDWNQIKLLSVQVNRLERWYQPGLLCIGDAAHAMSPVGGIGINLAIQDAVAASNILAEALHTGFVSGLTLAEVQHRRELPTRLTQNFQVFAHRMMSKFLGNPAPMKAPRILKLLSSIPAFRRLTGRFIGMGLRPEHINPH